MDYGNYAAGVVKLTIEGAAYPKNGTPNPPLWVSSPFWVDSTAVNENKMDFPIPLSHPTSSSYTPLRMSAQIFGYTAGGLVPLRQSWVITLGT